MTDHVSVTKLARWSPVVIGIAAFVLYLLTAGPSIVELFDDSLEFQLVGPTFGIAHPTGYPLYVLLGGLWSRVLLPFGNWAWRMNVFSAFWGGVAIALLYALTGRLVTWSDGSANLWAGLAAALAFGLGPAWWSQATIAEVYTLHIALVTAILSVTIGMDQGGNDTPFDQRALDRRMTWLSLLLGLGLAHHRSTVLLFPAILFYLLWSVPDIWRPRWVWLRWAAALMAPLLLYLFIPWRAAMGVADLNASYLNTWPGFWRHVLASGYAEFFAGNDLSITRDLRDWLALARYQIGALSFVLGLLGLAWLVDRNRRPAKAWIFVLFVLLTNLLFALNYRVGDVEVFLLPVFLCAAIFIGGGVGLIGRLLQDKMMWANVIQALLVLALGFGIGGRGPAVVRSQDWAAHDYAVALAKVDFPEGSRVVGLEGEMTALKYMQQAEGLGLAATPMVADDPDARRQIIAELVAAGAPTYMTRELAGIEEQYSFTGQGPLVRVWPRGQSRTSEPAVRLDLPLLDGALMVEGVDLAVLEQAGGPALQVIYYWRPQAKLDRDYKLSMRVVGPEGEPLAWPGGAPAVQDAFPVRQAALTRHWLVDERLADVHYIPLPHDGQPAAALETIVYDAETVEEIGRWQMDLQ